MKIRRHFFFTISDVKVSRTYGGSDYTVTVYENRGKGKIERVGASRPCTKAHRGEIHEAWCVVVKNVAQIRRQVEKEDCDPHYYRDGEKLGILLEEI